MTNKNVIFFTDFHAHIFTEFSKPSKYFVTDRFEEQMQVLQKVFDLARENNADIIFGGDLFHKRGAVDVRVLNRVFSVISSNEDVRLVLLRGNHDSYSNSLYTDSSLEVFQALSNVEVISTPRKLDMGNYTIYGLPYGDETSRMKEWVKAKVDYIEGTKEDSTHPKNKPDILVGHLGVEGATTGKSNHRLEGAFTIGDLHPDVFDFILLGHYHKRQYLADNCIYGGNTIQNSFSDEGQDKGVFLLTFEGSKVNSEFIPINSRKFITINGADIPKDFEALAKDNFIRFIGNKKQLKVIDKIRKEEEDIGNIRVMVEKDYTIKTDIDIKATSSSLDVVKAYTKKFYPEIEKEAIDCLQEALLLED